MVREKYVGFRVLPIAEALEHNCSGQRTKKREPINQYLETVDAELTKRGQIDLERGGHRLSDRSL